MTSSNESLSDCETNHPQHQRDFSVSSSMYGGTTDGAPEAPRLSTALSVRVARKKAREVVIPQRRQQDIGEPVDSPDTNTSANGIPAAVELSAERLKELEEFLLGPREAIQNEQAMFGTSIDTRVEEIWRGLEQLGRPDGDEGNDTAKDSTSQDMPDSRQTIDSNQSVLVDVAEGIAPFKVICFDVSHRHYLIILTESYSFDRFASRTESAFWRQAAGSESSNAHQKPTRSTKV